MWGGQEEWSTGLFLGNTSADSETPTQEHAVLAAAAFRSFFINVNTNISNAYSFTMAKVASIGTDGKTIEDEVFYAPPIAAAVGANSTVKLPSQCSIALTLLSARPRGLAAKGRMYLPGTASLPTATGRLSSTDQGNLLAQADTFISNFTNQFVYPGVLILAAKGTGPFPNLTAQNDTVTRIRVGDVIDTQRRRRNGLSEMYQEASVA